MKYTMQDFKTQKIACMPANEDEQSRFLQECGKSGLTWRDGDGVPRWYIGQTIACGFCGGTKACGVDKKRYSHAHDAHKNEGWEIIPFTAFDFAQPEPEQPAPVTSAHAPIWAGIVTEEMTSQQVNAMLDELRKVRYAKRQAEKPAEDKPAEPAEPAPPQEYVEVKRKARVGDWINIKESEAGTFVVGSVHRCAESNEQFIAVHGTKARLYTTKYTVLVPVRRENRRANVGEWVEILNDIHDGLDVCSAGTYKVVRYCQSYNHPVITSEKGACCLLGSDYTVLVGFTDADAPEATK